MSNDNNQKEGEEKFFRPRNHIACECIFTHRTQQYLYTYNDQTDCFTSKQNDRKQSFVSPHPGISFEKGFVWLMTLVSFTVTLWLGLIIRIQSMIVGELSLTLFADFTQYICAGGEDVLRKEKCVLQPPCCLQCALYAWQQGRAHCSNLHTKTILKKLKKLYLMTFAQY